MTIPASYISIETVASPLVCAHIAVLNRACSMCATLRLLKIRSGETIVSPVSPEILLDPFLEGRVFSHSTSKAIEFRYFPAANVGGTIEMRAIDMPRAFDILSSCTKTSDEVSKPSNTINHLPFGPRSSVFGSDLLVRV